MGAGSARLWFGETGYVNGADAANPRNSKEKLEVGQRRGRETGLSGGERWIRTLSTGCAKARRRRHKFDGRGAETGGQHSVDGWVILAPLGAKGAPRPKRKRWRHWSGLPRPPERQWCSCGEQRDLRHRPPGTESWFGRGLGQWERLARGERLQEGDLRCQLVKRRAVTLAGQAESPPDCVFRCMPITDSRRSRSVNPVKSITYRSEATRVLDYGVK